MKVSKIMVSTILIIALVVTMPSTAFASEKTDNQMIDLYAKQYQEIVECDDTTYQISYDYDEAGNRKIEIFDLFNGKRDVLRVDEKNGIVIFNDKSVASMQPAVERIKSENDSVQASAWEYFTSFRTTVSIADVATVVAFATFVAGVIGCYCTVAAVISAMTANTISYIVSTATWATITGLVYKFNSTINYQFRYDWIITTSNNNTYGTYRSFSSVY